MKLAKVEYCNLCFFSKNGLFLLYVVDNKIFLMEIEHLSINKIYVTSYKIDHIEFSSDNVHFLVLMKDKGCIVVYSFYDDDIIYKIEDHFQKYTHSFFINKYNYICVLKYEQVIKKSIIYACTYNTMYVCDFSRIISSYF